MIPIAPTYLSMTESPAGKLTPQQEAERRQRQQRINRAGRPNMPGHADPFDVASATLHARLQRSSRTKSGTAMRDLADLQVDAGVEGTLAEVQEEGQCRVLAAGKSNAQDLALERAQEQAAEAARLQQGVVRAHAARAEVAVQDQRIRVQAQNRNAAALLESGFDAIHRAGARLLPGAQGGSIEETLHLLQEMAQDVGQLPLSAYEKDNAATHSARLQVSFDFLQGYYSGLPLSATQQDAVQHAIANARASVEQSMQEAAARQREQVDAVHASLSAPGQPLAATEGEGKSAAGTAQEHIGAAVPERTERSANSGGLAVDGGQDAADSESENKRIRRKLNQYQEKLDQLAQMLPGLGRVSGNGELVNQNLAQLRQIKPEISLLRMQRMGQDTATVRHTILASLDRLELASKTVLKGNADKETLLKAITTERERLAGVDEKRFQAGVQAHAEKRTAQQLQDARHQQRTLLQINTGSVS
ncbi:MAG: hypothetical protein ACRYGK_03590 [Janthinobacterium lividum]